LYVAKQMTFSLPDRALADTTEWLMHPERWEENHGEAGFNDKKLERIEFANTMLAAFDAGVIADEKLIREAAAPLVETQDASGAWLVDPESAVASPATYGPALATYMARRVLERSGDPATAGAIRRADEWLLQAKAGSVMNASAIVMAFAGKADSRARGKIDEALALLIRAQSHDGGWGPYPNSPTEIFDSALAVLALAAVRDRPGIQDNIRRGRSFLIENQLPEGGWPETTRPAGGRSYAEHISTSGWAAMALLRTR
jgi:hypothetical protein